MKHLSIYKKVLPAAFLTLLPTFLQADCIPSSPSGYTVPFKLVTLKQDHYASYATGTLTISESSGVLDWNTTLSATHVPQLFSERFIPSCPGSSGICLNQQPFDIYQADQLGVSIDKATVVGPKGETTSINVTFTLESWGNGKESFAASCNASTGELYGTFDSNTFAVISFGTPEAPQPPPK